MEVAAATVEAKRATKPGLAFAGAALGLGDTGRGGGTTSSPCIMFERTFLPITLSLRKVDTRHLSLLSWSQLGSLGLRSHGTFWFVRGALGIVLGPLALLLLLALTLTHPTSLSDPSLKWQAYLMHHLS